MSDYKTQWDLSLQDLFELDVPSTICVEQLLGPKDELDLRYKQNTA